MIFYTGISVQIMEKDAGTTLLSWNCLLGLAQPVNENSLKCPHQCAIFTVILDLVRSLPLLQDYPCELPHHKVYLPACPLSCWTEAP